MSIESCPHITIVGAGQMGSRHLQGLALIDREIDVSVVDPSNSSLKLAETRFQEMAVNEFVRSVTYSESMETLDKNIDLAIIASNSNVRRRIIEDLLDRVDVRYMILEKVAFQSVDDFQAVLELFKKEEVKAWVNCAKRMHPVYKNIRRELRDEDIIHMQVIGGKWGLACNAIHLLDLFAFLTGEIVQKIDTSGLDPKIYESKRNGFIELGGKIESETPRGDYLTLTDNKELKEIEIQQHITSDNHHYNIFQLDGKYNHEHKKNGWQVQEETFPEFPQSQLTHLIVQSVLDSGECDLSSLDESYILHKPMLEGFINHIEKITGKKYDKCPIT